MPRFHLKPLRDQTIVVTGATSGIGLATALGAAHRGAHVVLVARDEDALAQVAERIRRDGGRADTVSADMGDRTAVRRIVETVLARHGGFDTWVNNAGVGMYATLEETSDADHERLFQTNYWGVVYGSTEALKVLKRRGGALINIGSIASDMPAPILSAYAASKHAVKGFTDSLRLELLHEGAPVSVTLIQPSGIHTPFGSHARNYMDEASRVPPPVYAPEVVADAILHAAEHPMRDVIVGGAGRAQVLLSRLAPNLADRLFAAAFFQTARDPDREKRNTQGLHRPGSGGRLYGDQDDSMRHTSVYTQARLHPGTTLAAGLAMGAVALGLGMARSAMRSSEGPQTRRGGEYRRSRPPMRPVPRDRGRHLHA